MSQPVNVGCRHRFSAPRRHQAHVPSVLPSHGTPIRSPIANRPAPAPQLRRPCRRSRGRRLPPAACGGRSHSARCRSVRQTPQQLIRTRTWPGPGSGSARSIASQRSLVDGRTPLHYPGSHITPAAQAGGRTSARSMSRGAARYRNDDQRGPIASHAFVQPAIRRRLATTRTAHAVIDSSKASPAGHGDRRDDLALDHRRVRQRSAA